MFNSKKEATDASTIQTNGFIGKGTRIQGDIHSEGSLRLEGQVEGSVHTRSKLVMAAGSNIKGDVIAKNAEISGLLEGNLKIKEVLTLKADAAVRGDIQTNRLIVESGARFDGTCNMRTQNTAPNEEPNAIPKNKPEIKSKQLY